MLSFIRYLEFRFNLNRRVGYYKVHYSFSQAPRVTCISLNKIFLSIALIKEKSCAKVNHAASE